MAARMNADDVKPSRLAAAKEAAGRLIAAASDYDEMAILSAAQAPTVRGLDRRQGEAAGGVGLDQGR